MQRQSERRAAVVSSALTEHKICNEPKPAPCGIVLFGASGDLTERKLIPALWRLDQGGLLPEQWYLLGLGRTPLDDEAFRKLVRGALQKISDSAAASEKFVERFFYLSGDFQESGSHTRLAEQLSRLDKERQTSGARLFYLAVPPGLYSGIIHQLGTSGLSRSAGEAPVRIIIEKPFGSDLASAQALSEEIERFFKEEQVYRIDHYLGKETVQNILFFRFANAIFEPTWSRNYIDHVQVTAAEQLGVEHRAGYYEGAGALRDMFQNHLLELLCLVAMEPPASFDADRIRDEKVKVMRSIRPILSEEVDRFAIRGQYGPGEIDGKPVPGYREEPGVAPDSKTETYAALKFYIDNWRWQGVPFYLRSGKRLANRTTKISIQFKQVPHLLFKPLISDGIRSNILIISVQPGEGISLNFQAKRPGEKLSMANVAMNFNYRDSFSIPSPDAYQRLLLDALVGDPTLFSRRDWVELSWSLLMPILDHWKEAPAPDFPNYPAGSVGPKEADALIEDGRRWRPL